MSLLVVILALQLVTLSRSAVQNTEPEVGVGGFLAEKRYVYHYRSVAAIHSSINITLQAEVSAYIGEMLSERSVGGIYGFMSGGDTLRLK